MYDSFQLKVLWLFLSIKVHHVLSVGVVLYTDSISPVQTVQVYHISPVQTVQEQVWRNLLLPGLCCSYYGELDKGSYYGDLDQGSYNGGLDQGSYYGGLDQGSYYGGLDQGSNYKKS